jgi:hypothetical protein
MRGIDEISWAEFLDLKRQVDIIAEAGMERFYESQRIKNGSEKERRTSASGTASTRTEVKEPTLSEKAKAIEQGEKSVCWLRCR